MRLSLSAAVLIWFISTSQAMGQANFHVLEYLVADCEATADRCIYTGQGQSPVEQATVVDTIRGNAAYGKNICKINLTSAPLGVNTMALVCKRSSDQAVSSSTQIQCTQQPYGVWTCP